jgi:hypothetical protein
LKSSWSLELEIIKESKVVLLKSLDTLLYQSGNAPRSTPLIYLDQDGK